MIDRESVRVDVYFPVRWKRSGDPTHISSIIQSHRTCDRFSAPPSAVADLPADLTELTEFQETTPHIYRMWMSIERKLDHIIWSINKDQYDDPEMEEGICINMSQGGASILVSSQVPVGEFVQLRMMPPTFPVFLVEIVGKTLSCSPDPDSRGKWTLGLEFTALNSNDREDLITYIFKRQREILRDGSS